MLHNLKEHWSSVKQYRIDSFTQDKILQKTGKELHRSRYETATLTAAQGSIRSNTEENRDQVTERDLELYDRGQDKVSLRVDFPH